MGTKIHSPDLLTGYEAIGRYLGMTARQVEHLRTLPESPPTFKVGRRICAHEAALDQWLNSREATDGAQN